MKQTLRNFIINAAAVSVLTSVAVAQDAITPTSVRHDAPGDRPSHERPAERLQGVAKASDLIGMTVKNRQEETLGKVADLAVDVESGRIIAVILSSGGFLGIGDELSAVPPRALRFNATRDTLQLDASKETLSNAPHFKASQWPDFAQPGYSGGIYRAYQIEPYFATNVTGKADHSVRNVGDRDERSLTPLDQCNSKTDLATTAQIRKDILVGGLTVNAQNVKIITQDGLVALRGPVNSPEEKRVILIGEIANRVARSQNVDNQLEVKVTTSSLK
jgi:hypothetical protein